MNLNKLGIRKEDNYHKEEYTYFIGSKGNIPIALFLMIASGYQNSIARYLTQITYSKQANEWQKIIRENNLEISEQFKDDFEGIAKQSFTGKLFNFEDLPLAPADWMEKIANPAYETPLPLHVYSAQFAKLTCMATPKYESGGESIIMTCPMSYINFLNRKEFAEVDIALNTAIEHVLNEFLRVLKLRGIPFNEIDMTIPMNKYKGYQFIHSYGW